MDVKKFYNLMSQLRKSKKYLSQLECDLLETKYLRCAYLEKYDSEKDSFLMRDLSTTKSIIEITEKELHGIFNLNGNKSINNSNTIIDSQ